MAPSGGAEGADWAEPFGRALGTDCASAGGVFGTDWGCAHPAEPESGDESGREGRDRSAGECGWAGGDSTEAGAVGAKSAAWGPPEVTDG